MGIIEKAKELRKVIEANAAKMDDSSALKAMELFSTWSGSGVTYAAGDRVRYEGVLYKVTQGHSSQEDWSPAAAPSLFAEVLPGQDGTEIGDWRQPGSTNPYMKGDKVRFNGAVYESVIDNNVYSPADYPAGWKTV